MSHRRRREVEFDPGSNVQRGIRTVASILAPTLGPTPRTVAIASPTHGTRVPELLDDGGVIARRMVHLADRGADPGAMLLRGALLRVHELVGDGVATTAVMVRAIHDACYRAIVAGGNAMRIREELDDCLAIALDHLGRQTMHPIDRDRIERVARTVCPDERLAVALAGIFDLIGEHGQIELRTGQIEAPRHEILDGAFWDSKPFTRTAINDLPARRLDLERPAVFLSDFDISDPQVLVPILRTAMSSGAGSLVIMAAKLSDECANLLSANFRPTFPIMAVQTPAGPPGQHTDALDDLAAYTGARMFRAAAGDRTTGMEDGDLGRSRRGWVDLSHVGLIGPGGNTRAWQRQVADLRDRLCASDEASDRTRYEARIARLTGANAVLWVNGMSVPAIDARKELARRTERAIRSALREGVVPGGGVALLACREHLAKLLGDSMDPDRTAAIRALMAGLEAPFRTIARNSGLDPSVVLASFDRMPGDAGWDARTGTVGDASTGVLDSAGVVQTALRIAVGTASQALTIGAVIRPRKPEDLSLSQRARA